MWEKKKVLVTVKAYPEPSTKYKACVCTSGITEDGEWIRLYPIPFEIFRSKKTFRKYDWIEVECRNNSKSEKLRRKESHKIRPNTLKIVDTSLNERPTDWKSRNEIVLPMLEKSVERLRESYSEDKTSLGLIKPKDLFNFYMSEELNEDDKTLAKAKECYQETLFGEKRSDLEILPHVFRYRFSCQGESCKNHDITCEDWELFQSYRSWRWTYPRKEVLWEKLKQRYFDEMITKKDLYFYMGTYFLQPSWLIIGLYYPPKVI
ncbi:MAG: hypothetical protein V3T58_02530 [Candidatus Hydrothermarchaeales archaeon]